VERARLNLGCGYRKLDGYFNVDHDAACSPDLVCDLESTPWAIESDSVDEILLSHVLEHLGREPRVYLRIIQELYRVCRHDARVHIVVPHPRHDDFLVDPTHVRPILPEQFLMFSKAKNRDWIARGVANTTLALQLDVDFEVENLSYTLDAAWAGRQREGAITPAELQHAIVTYANVVRQFELVLRVIKR
jgi:hypothetical protein